MKWIGLFVCVVLAVVALSYAPADAGVYRSKVRASCSGNSTVREYSRGRATCSGVSRSRAVGRAKRSCAGG